MPTPYTNFLGGPVFWGQVNYNPFVPIDKEISMKIIIKNEEKKTIERQLNLFGVNSYTIFPDLEGLGASFRKRFSPFIPS